MGSKSMEHQTQIFCVNYCLYVCELLNEKFRTKGKFQKKGFLKKKNLNKLYAIVSISKQNTKKGNAHL